MPLEQKLCIIIYALRVSEILCTGMGLCITRPLSPPSAYQYDEGSGRWWWWWWWWWYEDEWWCYVKSFRGRLFITESMNVDLMSESDTL